MGQKEFFHPLSIDELFLKKQEENFLQKKN